MNVFVCGPMNGYPDFNFPRFLAVEKMIISNGDVPISMRQIVIGQFNGDTSRPHQEYMAAALCILPKVDQVRVLPGWAKSRGARCEVAVALTLEIPVADENGEVLNIPSVTVSASSNQHAR